MPRSFKIHSIALTKNEADVIAYNLVEAAKWSDFIYVYDGLSTDGTWEIVKTLAEKEKKIIPWKQDGQVFKEGLRAEVFEAFRHQAEEGDWWVQLNVDEFYVDNPREFFAAIPPHYHMVWAIFLNFYITEKDLAAINFDAPIEQVIDSLQYYRANHSEPHAFRHRNRLQWSSECAWPNHSGVVYPKRIKFRHYPYRSPEQISNRLSVRRDNRARGFDGWEHASQKDWREKIVNAEDMNVDKKDGNWVIDESALRHHLEGQPKRLMKQIMHFLGIWP